MRNFIIRCGLVLTCFGANVQAGTISVSGADYELNNGAGSVTVYADTAETVTITPVFEDVRFVAGNDGSVNKLGKLQSGTYQLSLTDFEFPAAFSELKVAVTTATQLVSVLSLGDANSISQLIQLAANESYYLSVFASTSSPSVYGLYGVQLAQYSSVPVPVPASALLLLSGLMCMGFSAQRKRMGKG
ncbi:MAG TPA: hypothetical protein VM553_11920 [Dongiaceae bacterium]|nr:hypothetical protein [Dongiaceae bacterium]